MTRAPLRALLTANAVSISGTSMTLLALPWFVLSTTGSAGRTGVVAACEGLALGLASAFGGPLVDRLGPRRTTISSDLLSALGISLIPLLHATGSLAFWALCAIVLLVGLLRAPGETARYVLLPHLVRLSGTPLERATSLYDGVSRGARMLGGPLAGVLIAAVGPADVLLVDAATFLASAGLVARAVPVVAVHGERSPYLQQLRAGLSTLRADSLLRSIVLMVLVTNLLDAAWSSVLLPVYSRGVLHSSVALGVLVGAFGLGALAGTLVYGAVGPRLPRWPVFTLAFLLCGSPRLFVMAADVPLPVLVAVIALGGLAAGSLNPILSAVELERVPERLRASVYGVTTAGVIAGVPVGALLGGLAVQHVGVHVVLVGTGLVYLAATLAPVLGRRTWRQLDHTRGAVHEGATMAV